METTTKWPKNTQLARTIQIIKQALHMKRSKPSGGEAAVCFLSITIEPVSKPDEEGYIALCPELDVASQGDTIEEALSNIKEAVTEFLDTLADFGEDEDYLKACGIDLHRPQEEVGMPVQVAADTIVSVMKTPVRV